MSLKNVYKDIQPNVIDNELLARVLNEQAPKGEAGKLKIEEGINFPTVVEIRIEFLSKYNQLSHSLPTQSTNRKNRSKRVKKIQ